MEREDDIKEKIMATSSSLLTVDQAAALLGLSWHAVVELIGTGKLTWTMAADKRTVLVEVPLDQDTFLREIGRSVTSREAACEASPTGQSDAKRETRRRRGDRPAISDLDAWSQPK